jgi:vacuolar-type H+-ATPase subunit H
MPMEAIQSVSEAEREAKAALAEQSLRSRRLVEQAHAEGAELLAAAEREGRAAWAERLGRAEDAAAVKARRALEENEASAASLREAARAKLPDAKQLILERLVNG